MCKNCQAIRAERETKAALLDLIMTEAFTGSWREPGHAPRFVEGCTLEEWLELDHPEQTALLRKLYPVEKTDG